MATIKGIWEWNEVLVNDIDIRVSLNFTAYNNSYDGISITVSGSNGMLVYAVDGIYSHYVYNTLSTGWLPTDRIIDFGETEQTVSDEFYAWFTANSIELKVTDLTNTTWHVPSGWQAKHAYGTFAINYSVLYNSKSLESSTLGIGFDSGANDDGTNCIAFIPHNHMIYNGIAFTISITDGDDVANSDLIAWLSQYGELQEGEPTQIQSGVYAVNTAYQDATALKNFYSSHDLSVLLESEDAQTCTFLGEHYYGIGIGWEWISADYGGIDFTKIYPFDYDYDSKSWYDSDTPSWYEPATSTFSLNKSFDVTAEQATFFNTIFTRIGDIETPDEPEKPEETKDTKPVYLRKNGAWVKQDAYERQNGEWVQISHAGEQGYSVTVIVSEVDKYSGTVLDIYDGQDTTSEPIGTLTANEAGDSWTGNITSGYITIDQSEGGYPCVERTEVSDGILSLPGSDYGDTYTTFAIGADGTIALRLWDCFVEGTQITLANGNTKSVEDISYDDELLVWDFYNGTYATAKPFWIMIPKVATYYYKITLSNGNTVNLVGSGGNCHRVFSVTQNKFIYATQCVGDEIYTKDGVFRMVSCERIYETVRYYNLKTEKYHNCFANGFLTCGRHGNMYDIENMRYCSDVPNFTEEELAEREASWEKKRLPR